MNTYFWKIAQLEPSFINKITNFKLSAGTRKEIKKKRGKLLALPKDFFFFFLGNYGPPPPPPARIILEGSF